MTFFELHELIPVVVAENMDQIKSAEQYVADLLDATEPNSSERREVMELVGLIETRKNQIEKFQKGIQQSIHQLAIFSHKNEGFKIPEVNAG